MVGFITGVCELALNSSGRPFIVHLNVNIVFFTLIRVESATMPLLLHIKADRGDEMLSFDEVSNYTMRKPNLI